ncbi:MAG: hypothetical protein PHV28_04955 [Kiritimatiellae bacterium]|nr:hypothetical protein [Kiritimatiellia bacterium]
MAGFDKNIYAQLLKSVENGSLEMTKAVLNVKLDAGNPHVRFDEGEVAPAKSRRWSRLCCNKIMNLALAFCCVLTGAHAESYEVTVTKTEGEKIVDAAFVAAMGAADTPQSAEYRLPDDVQVKGPR